MSEKDEFDCPECDGLGYVYEGGMSMNEEMNVRVPCPNGCEEC